MGLNVQPAVQVLIAGWFPSLLLSGWSQQIPKGTDT